MTLPSSPNSISLNQVQTEFGGSNPISISEYYSVEASLPVGGTIALSDFHGLSKPVSLTSGVNVQQILASDYISDGGTLTIPSGVYVWSDNTSTAALIVDVNNATIINNGYIIGKGGAGATVATYAVAAAGSDGGPAIKVTGTNAIITNNSGAYIAGGGGGGGGGRMAGGGGGAGGGAGGNGIGYGTGGGSAQNGGIGGLPGQSGTGGGTTSGTAPADETIGEYNWGGSDGGEGDRGGHGGGAGGGGATGIDTGSSNGLHGGGGGGGGRVLPGTGGNGGDRSGSGRSSGREGGDGGSAGNAGDFGLGSYGGEDGAGGGGGWGAAGGAGALSSNGNGGAGGAGGKAIEVASGGSAIIENNGTRYGTSEAADAVTLTTSTLVNNQNNRKQITVSSFISSGQTLIIPANMWVWSDSTSTPALTIDISCTISNYGKIIGRGGDGGDGASAGEAGGNAVKINSGVTGVTITNNSGAYIAGGGGGGGGVNNGSNDGSGGGGAGGGEGGKRSNIGTTGGTGGALNAKGENGDGWQPDQHCWGGEAGGSGGYASETSGGNGYGCNAGGGGRILPGTQTANASVGIFTTYGKGGGGGQAGEAGVTGGNTTRGAGGGGWGAAGGGSNGGAAGKAIEDSGVTYTLTNNGTIYGST